VILIPAVPRFQESSDRKSWTVWASESTTLHEVSSALLALLSLAVIGGISRFRWGTHSTPARRGFIISWLIFSVGINFVQETLSGRWGSCDSSVGDVAHQAFRRQADRFGLAADHFGLVSTPEFRRTRGLLGSGAGNSCCRVCYCRTRAGRVWQLHLSFLAQDVGFIWLFALFRMSTSLAHPRCCRQSVFSSLSMTVWVQIR
jgi:hypothetical protein